MMNEPVPKKEEDAVSEKRKKFHAEMRAEIEASKEYRKKLIPLWSKNIDYRRGKPLSSQTDEDRVVVPLDWSLTKAKQASLFSQIPQIRVDHHPQTQQAGPWLSAFEQRLNDTIVVAGIEAVMDECLPDCINAAGIGAVIVSHEALTEEKDVPAIDLSMLPPEMQAQILKAGTFPDGSPVPMETVPVPTDHRYVVTRISPADLILPCKFTGSDFDNGPFIGHTGRLSWAEAVNAFKLTEDQKQKVLGDDRVGSTEKLTQDWNQDHSAGKTEVVVFDEIFYKQYKYDKDAKSYYTLGHLVFVNGLEKPVIDEPWRGQEFGENGQLLGALKYPVRILTLTYITDDLIPPSDSAVGRAQVNEINKSRTQMIMQRDRSLPIRWFNNDRIDPSIGQGLMRGTWGAMIPVQGSGENVIGEIARASMPVEDFTFDTIIKRDLSETWQVAGNQLGQGDDVETKAEANIIQGNFQARVGRERAKVAKFFVSIAEVLGGLLCLYEEPQSFGEGFDPAISRTLSYSILADSTVLIDSNQRLQRLMQFVNYTAKSGFVNIEPVLREVATLSGLDPNVVIQKPGPKPPVEPNISLRLTGMEDMMNPLTLAFLMKSGQAPPPELIEQAKKLIEAAVAPPAGFPPDLWDMLTKPQLDDQAAEEEVAPPEPAPPAVGMAHPDWGLNPKVNSRESAET
jgi:hypothetical protein